MRLIVERVLDLCVVFLHRRYNTGVEKATITKQLMELYSVEEDSLHCAVATLEHALATFQTDIV